METLAFVFGGAGLLGFIGTIITVLASRNKNKAETRKIKVETDEKLVALQGELQDQIFALVEHNKKMFEEREKERDAKRTELNSLTKRIEILSEMVSNGQSREIKLMNEKAEQEKMIHRLEENFVAMRNDVTKIKRVTGQLGKE